MDKLGNLDDAVAVAAKRAGLNEYHEVHYPVAKVWWEKILDSQMQDYTDAQLRSYLGELYPAVSLLKNIDKRDKVQALIPFTPVIR